jgi:outer membrane protein OmpA-like peptidoglycan-associated protein
MINLRRLCVPVLLTLAASACSPIHNTLGPDKQQSDLRPSVEAPVNVASAESPFCEIGPMDIPQTPKLETLPEPFSAKLYFLLDKTEFTAESKAESRDIYQEILDREFSEIRISGHTDTAASDGYNQALSQRRAEKVRQDLISLGVPANNISITAEGEYHLLVATGDNTVEVRNRRVEINAR